MSRRSRWTAARTGWTSTAGSRRGAQAARTAGALGAGGLAVRTVTSDEYWATVVIGTRTA